MKDVINNIINICHDIVQNDAPIVDGEVMTFAFKDLTVRISLKDDENGGKRLSYEFSDDRVFTIDEETGFYN